MDKRISDRQASDYYLEALNRPAFIKDLSEYEQRRILELCEEAIMKGSYHLALAIEWNKDSPNIELNSKVVKEALLGKQLRLRNELQKALGAALNEEPIKAPDLPSFDSFLNKIAEESKLQQIISIGNDLKATPLVAFLFALKEEGLLQERFFDNQLKTLNEIVINQFKYPTSKQALGQALDRFNEDRRLNKRVITPFKNRIQAILNE